MDAEAIHELLLRELSSSGHAHTPRPPPERRPARLARPRRPTSPQPPAAVREAKKKKSDSSISSGVVLRAHALQQAQAAGEEKSAVDVSMLLDELLADWHAAALGPAGAVDEAAPNEYEHLESWNPDTWIRHQMAHVDKKLGDMRVFDTILKEVIASPSLCPSKPLCELLERVREGFTSHITPLEGIFAEVRRRLSLDWTLDSLEDKAVSITERSREKVRALQDEIDEQLREAATFQQDLELSRRNLEVFVSTKKGSLSEATAAAKSTIIPLSSGERFEGELRFESQYFTFETSANDQSVFVWLSQLPGGHGGTDDNYFDTFVRQGSPPTAADPGQYLSTTRSTSDTQLVVDTGGVTGDWYVRCQGYGSLKKVFMLEVRVQTTLMDVVAPLGDFLRDMELELEEAGFIKDQMGSLEDHVNVLEEAGAQIVRYANRSRVDAQTQWEPQQLERRRAASRNGGGRDAKMRFGPRLAPFLQTGQVPANVKALGVRQSCRLIMQLYLDKVAADKSDDRQRRPHVATFAQFVVDRFTARYGLRRLAELHLFELLLSVEQELSEPSPNARMALFGQFVGMHPNPGFTESEVLFFLRCFVCIRQEAATHKVAVFDDEKGVCFLPMDVVLAGIQSVFEGYSLSTKVARKMCSRHVHEKDKRRVNVDALLADAVTLYRHLESQHLRSKFRAYDPLSSGLLDFKAFVRLAAELRPTAQPLHAVKLYELFHEALVAGHTNMGISVNGLLAVAGAIASEGGESTDDEKEEKKEDTSAGAAVSMPELRTKWMMMSSTLRANLRLLGDLDDAHDGLADAIATQRRIDSLLAPDDDDDENEDDAELCWVLMCRLATQVNDWLLNM